MVIIYLVVASILVPVVLAYINKRAFKINGAPAWFITVAVCAIVSMLICALPGGWPMRPEWIAVLFLWLFFGSNGFYNLVVKHWFPNAP